MCFVLQWLLAIWEASSLPLHWSSSLGSYWASLYTAHQWTISHQDTMMWAFSSMFFFFFLQLAQGKLIPDVCLWDQRTFRTKFFKLTVESMQFWEPLNLYIIWQLLTTRVIMSHSFCCPSYSARTAGRLVQSCQPLCIGHHLSAKKLTVLRYYAHAKIIMPKNVNKIIKWSFSCLWLCMGIFREKDRVCYIATGIFLGLSHNQSSFAL